MLHSKAGSLGMSYHFYETAEKDIRMFAVMWLMCMAIYKEMHEYITVLSRHYGYRLPRQCLYRDSPIAVALFAVIGRHHHQQSGLMRRKMTLSWLLFPQALTVGVSYAASALFSLSIFVFPLFSVCPRKSMEYGCCCWTSGVFVRWECKQW